jgi:hypothetical protein
VYVHVDHWQARLFVPLGQNRDRQNGEQGEGKSRLLHSYPFWFSIESSRHESTS